MSDFKPLKITAEMQTNLAGFDLFFDGIIAKAVALEKIEKGELKYGVVNESNFLEFELSIEKLENKNYYIYKASRAIYSDELESVQYWRKKYHIKDLYLIEKNKVNIASGLRKEYNMPLVTTSADYIYFYTIGDMKTLGRLLENRIFAIGKKTSQGFGYVKKWILEEISIEKCFWYLRPIPLDLYSIDIINFETKSDFVISKEISAYKPPYWALKNQTDCVFIKLNKDK